MLTWLMLLPSGSCSSSGPWLPPGCCSLEAVEPARVAGVQGSGTASMCESVSVARCVHLWAIQTEAEEGKEGPAGNPGTDGMPQLQQHLTSQSVPVTRGVN